LSSVSSGRTFGERDYRGAEYRRSVAAGNHFGSDPDLLAGGSGRPLWSRSGRWAASVAIAAAIGLLVGYAAGHHRARTVTIRSPAPTTTPSHQTAPASRVIGPPLTQTDATCSIQHGHRLQLGIQIENQTTSIVHITGVRTREPLSGLEPVSTGVGACGQNKGSSGSFDPATVPAGAATWLTVTVQVHVKCPGPYPVQFRVDYRQGDRVDDELLAGFDDLTGVPYTGCAR
jgi:hypothetical protein